MSTHLPILITSLSHRPRRSSFDENHSLNLQHVRRPRSSSLTTPRRVRFHSRVLIRRRSNSVINPSLPLLGKAISTHSPNENSPGKLIERKGKEKQSLKTPLDLSTHSNCNEKKSIISHSMITTKNMRLPPTAMVFINQTSKPSPLPTSRSISNPSKKSTFTSQRPSIVHSIPIPPWKSTYLYQPDSSHLKIDPSFHSIDDDDSLKE